MNTASSRDKYQSSLSNTSTEVLRDLLKANKRQRDEHSQGPSLVLTAQHNLIMNELIRRA